MKFEDLQLMYSGARINCTQYDILLDTCYILFYSDY